MKTELSQRIRSGKPLKVSELAELLNISKRVLYKLVDRGTLAAYRIGSSVRLEPNKTADWLESCTV